MNKSSLLECLSNRVAARYSVYTMFRDDVQDINRARLAQKLSRNYGRPDECSLSVHRYAGFCMTWRLQEIATACVLDAILTEPGRFSRQ